MVVFESHLLEVEENGVITKYRLDGKGSYIALTGTQDDCRQPNWSPINNLIVYEKVHIAGWKKDRF
jgi:hypothetical protein